MSSVFTKYGLLRQRLLLVSRTECKHFLHPWSSSCTRAAIGLAIACAIFSMKIYPIVYFIGFVTKQKLPTKQDIYRFLIGILTSTSFLTFTGFSYSLQMCFFRNLLGILTSTSFLTFTGFSYSLQMCFFRNLLGHFNYGSITLLPMFLTSLMAIEIERDSRKTALALYVANLATETVWNMAKSRHLVRDIPFANTLIFSVSTAVLLFFSQYFPRDFFLGYVKKLKGTRNVRCIDHNNNCSRYILKTCFKHFWIGYGISAVTQTILKFNIRKLFAIKNFRLASFLAAYPLIYNVIVCGSRKWSDSLAPVNRNLLKFGAAILAGTSFQLVANKTVSLYMFWKMLHILSLFAVAKNHLKPHRKYPILLYSICTAILFHVAVFEPHNLRRTYWKFLNDVSGRRIATMDRTFIEQLYQPDLNRNLSESMKAIGYDSKVIHYQIGKFCF